MNSNARSKGFWVLVERMECLWGLPRTGRPYAKLPEGQTCEGTGNLRGGNGPDELGSWRRTCEERNCREGRELLDRGNATVEPWRRSGTTTLD